MTTTELTTQEHDRLDVLTKQVATGLTTFVEVGVALAEIRDRELYRETHPAFKDFCRDRFSFTASRANQLIGAAGAVKAVEVHSPYRSPTNAGQASELTRCPSAEVIGKAWSRAFETAPTNSDGLEIITAQHVKKVVAEIVGAKPAPKPAPELKDRLGRVVESALVESNQNSRSLRRSRSGHIQLAWLEVKRLAELPGGQYIDLEGIERLVELLSSAIRFAEYHTTCPDCKGVVGNRECAICGGSGFIVRSTYNRLTDEQKSWLSK